MYNQPGNYFPPQQGYNPQQVPTTYPTQQQGYPVHPQQFPTNIPGTQPYLIQPTFTPQQTPYQTTISYPPQQPPTQYSQGWQPSSQPQMAPPPYSEPQQLYMPHNQMTKTIKVGGPNDGVTTWLRWMGKPCNTSVEGWEMVFNVDGM